MVIGINVYEQEAARILQEVFGATKITTPGEFRCKACGRCCTEERDIPLNMTDVFRIAKHLRMTPEAFYNKYLHFIENEFIDDKPDKEYYMFGFRMDLGDERSCPFMVDRKCSIHEVKPITCKIYPYTDLRLFRGDAVKRIVTLHKDCSILDMDDDLYIVPDLDALYRRQLGVIMMGKYVDRAGLVFNPRVADNIYHQEMALIQNKKHADLRAESAEDALVDFMKYVNVVRQADLTGRSKEFFSKRFMYPPAEGDGKLNIS